MRIILVGPGASGKDHLKYRLAEKGLRASVSYTTRPMRSGEVEGVAYFFVSVEKFQDMVAFEEFYEYNHFGNGQYYGTSKEQFAKSEVLVMTPSGIAALTPEHRLESVVMYLDTPEEVRRKRLCERVGYDDDPERRLKTDREDFENFKSYDIKISNADF